MNVFLFVLIACFWGGSFVVIKPLIEIVPPLSSASIRILVAVLFLSALLPLIKIPFWLKKNIRFQVWMTGIFGFGLPFGLLFWGEKSISAGLAGILNGTVPLFVFVLGALFTPGVESITTRKTSGLLLGFLGLIFIFWPADAIESLTWSFWGAFAVFAMALSYSISVLLNRRIFTQNPDLNPLTNLFHQLLAGYIFIFPISIFFEGLPQVFSWRPFPTVALYLLYLGVGSTTIAFIFFYRLIKAWGSVRASTVTYIVPALALTFDFLFNGTRPNSYQIFGVIIVTVGVIVLNLPNKSLEAK